MTIDNLVELNFFGFLDSEEHIPDVRKAHRKKIEDKKRYERETKEAKKKGKQRESWNKGKDKGEKHYWNERVKIEDKLKGNRDISVFAYMMLEEEAEKEVVDILKDLTKYKNRRGNIPFSKLGIFPEEGSKTLNKLVGDLTDVYKENVSWFQDVSESIIFSRTGSINRYNRSPDFLKNEYKVVKSILENTGRAMDDGIISHLRESYTNMNIHWFEDVLSNIALRGAAYRVKTIERIARKAAKKLVDLVKEYKKYEKIFEQEVKNIKDDAKESGLSFDEKEFREDLEDKFGFKVSYFDLAINDMLGVGLILKDGKRFETIDVVKHVLKLDWLNTRTAYPGSQDTSRGETRKKKLEQEQISFFDMKKGISIDVHISYLNGILLDKFGPDPHHAYVENEHRNNINGEFGNLYRTIYNGYKDLLSKVEQPTLEEKVIEDITKREQTLQININETEENIKRMYGALKDDDIMLVAEKGRKDTKGTSIKIRDSGKSYKVKGKRPEIMKAWEELFDYYWDMLEMKTNKSIEDLYHINTLTTLDIGNKAVLTMPPVEDIEYILNHMETYVKFSTKHLGTAKSRFSGKRNKIKKRLNYIRKISETGGRILAKREEVKSIKSTSDESIKKFSKGIGHILRIERDANNILGSIADERHIYEIKAYCLRNALDSYTRMLNKLENKISKNKELTHAETMLIPESNGTRNALQNFYNKQLTQNMISEKEQMRYDKSLTKFDKVQEIIKEYIKVTTKKS